MDMTSITRHLGDAWERTASLMRSALGTDIGLLRATNEAILSHGGKQLRPMLCLLMARACGGGRTTEESVCYAAASEILHNATLIHDDVADKSDRRRGYPTAASVLGPSAAVLLGDFWLARAVQTIMAGGIREEALKMFSKTLSDLAEGEMLQLEKAELADTTEEDYYRIVYCKTASLFEAACTTGAMSVDAPERYLEAARRYAVALGIAFQIKDDILDYAGKEDVGKPLGADLREQKITLPLLGALRSGPAPEKIRNMVRTLPQKPENLEEIRAFVFGSGGVEYAYSCLEKHVDKALEALECLPPSEDKDMLSEIAVYNSSRTK